MSISVVYEHESQYQSNQLFLIKKANKWIYQNVKFL